MRILSSSTPKVNIPHTVYWSFRESLTIYVAYTLVSLFLFLVTSGGWTGVVVVMFGWIPYGILLLILLASVATQRKKNHKWIAIHKRDLSILLSLQAIALLLNIGDCGDAPGVHFFIEKLAMLGRDVCHSGVSIPDTWALPLFTLLKVSLWLYAILLSLLSLRSVVRATAEPTAASPLIRPLYFLPIAFFIVLATFAYDSFRYSNIQTRANTYQEYSRLMETKQCQQLEVFVKDAKGIEPEYQQTLIRDCWSNVAYDKNDSTVCQELTRTTPGDIDACVKRFDERKKDAACRILKKTDPKAGNECLEKLRKAGILEECARLEKSGAIAEYEACMKYAQQ